MNQSSYIFHQNLEFDARPEPPATATLTIVHYFSRPLVLILLEAPSLITNKRLQSLFEGIYIGKAPSALYIGMTHRLYYDRGEVISR